MNDRTIRPSHYVVTLADALKRAGSSDGTVVEVVDLIAALKLDFNRGNALKYLLRAGRKEEDGVDALTDYKKALTYVGFVLADLEAERAKPSAPPAFPKPYPTSSFWHGEGTARVDPNMILGVDVSTKPDGTDVAAVSLVDQRTGKVVATAVGTSGAAAMRALDDEVEALQKRAAAADEPPAPWAAKRPVWRCNDCGEDKTASERYSIPDVAHAVLFVCALCFAKRNAKAAP